MANFFDSVRPASFRGVPFGVLDTSDTRGRVTVVHEFPQNDKVYVEDLHRARRNIDLTAYVLNPGYEAKRDALIKALEAPGAGTLVHPHLGTFEVCLTAPAAITHSPEQGGYCAFQLSFTEQWTADSPAVTLDFGDIVLNFLSSAIDKVCGLLDNVFKFVDVVEDAIKSAFNFVNNIVKTVGAFVGKVFAVIDNVASFVNKLVDIGSLSGLVKDLFSFDFNLPSLSIRRRYDVLKDRVDNTKIFTMPDNLGVIRQQIALNDKAVNDFDFRMTSLAALSSLAFIRPDSTADAEFLRSSALSLADGLLMTDLPVDLFRTVRQLHVNVQRAIAEAAQTAPHIFVAVENVTSPLFAIAWNSILSSNPAANLEDVSKDLILRNKIVHPGFIPPGEVEVLSV